MSYAERTPTCTQTMVNLEIDIDAITITGPPTILSYINRTEFTFSSFKKPFERKLLLCINPGFIYIKKEWKEKIMDYMRSKLQVNLQASEDKYVLLRSTLDHRRMSSGDVVTMLLAIGCNQITFYDYAMKASIASYRWLDNLKKKIPFVHIILGFRYIGTYQRVWNGYLHSIPLVRYFDPEKWFTYGFKCEEFCTFALSNPCTDKFGTLLLTNHFKHFHLQKIKVYSKFVHDIKIVAGNNMTRIPKKMYVLRSAREKLKKALNIFDYSNQSMGLLRTEMTIRMDTLDHCINEFTINYGRLQKSMLFAELDIYSVQVFGRNLLAYLDGTTKLFKGRNSTYLSGTKRSQYIFMLNQIGLTNKNVSDHVLSHIHMPFARLLYNSMEVYPHIPGVSILPSSVYDDPPLLLPEERFMQLQARNQDGEGGEEETKGEHDSQIQERRPTIKEELPQYFDNHRQERFQDEAEEMLRKLRWTKVRSGRMEGYWRVMHTNGGVLRSSRNREDIIASLLTDASINWRTDALLN